MSTISFILDSKELQTVSGKSVLEASLDNGIYIPHLCHHPDLHDIGGCNLCVIRVEGMDGIQNACKTKVVNGMHVMTNDPELKRIRQTSIELIMANHIDDCSDCPKYMKCELQSLIQYMGTGSSRMRTTFRSKVKEMENPLILRDMSRCVSCGRCVRACAELRGVGALEYGKDQDGRSFIVPRKNHLLIDSECRFCGACVEVCPTGALRDKEGIFSVPFARGKQVIACQEECPAHIDISAYVRECKAGNWDNALAIIRESVPFPNALGKVCVRSCESKCRRQYLDRSVQIRELKRLAAENGGETWKEKLVIANDTGKKVAVVGGGPAGLSAAWYLRLKGHQVDVFEKEPEAGGMLRYGIPAYRLSDDEVRKEIKYIEDIGVHIMTEHTPAKEELDHYDSVVWAVGTSQGARLPIEGNDAKGVMSNMEFLKNIRKNNPPQIDSPVLVLGGGNVAFDCARSAVRLGAEKVVMACLEAREKMTADAEEINEGMKEGITIYNSLTFKRAVAEDGRVTGVECERVRNFYFDENKRLQLEIEPGSAFVIPCRSLIFATGLKTDIPEYFDAELSPRKLIVADEDNRTSKDGVFAAGDVIYGTASVIKAIESGKTAAKSVDKFLGGDGDIQQVLRTETTADAWIGKEDSFWMEYVKACDSVCGMDDAQRCLQCDLRANMTRSKFQSDYSCRI